MAEALKITVDTGIETIEIYNENGSVIGEFQFNPADINMLLRAEEVIDFFNGLRVEDDLPSDKYAQEAERLCAAIGQQFDYLLGFEVAESIFSKCSALTPVRDGDYYFEKVFEGIARHIEKVTNARINKKLGKARTAAAKYKK